MYKIAAVGNLPHIRALALIGVDWYEDDKNVADVISRIVRDKEYAILIVSEDVYENHKDILDNTGRPEFSVVILGKDEEKASQVLERKIERALGIRIFE